MSLTRSAERAALNKLIDYLDDNPQENIDKIMDLVNKLVPNRVFPVQREAFTNVIKSRGNWYDLIMRVFSLNPQMRTKLLKTLIVDANLLAWPEQEKNREKYQCNVPWAILLDPTSACNLHCTGCWAAEYGHKLNLSYDDIDSIINQANELGTHTLTVTVSFTDGTYTEASIAITAVEKVDTTALRAAINKAKTLVESN